MESGRRLSRPAAEGEAGPGTALSDSRWVRTPARRCFPLTQYQPDNHRCERGLNIYTGTRHLMEANDFESLNEENVSLKQTQAKHRTDMERSRKHGSIPSYLTPRGLAGNSSDVQRGRRGPVRSPPSLSFLLPPAGMPRCSVNCARCRNVRHSYDRSTCLPGVECLCPSGAALGLGSQSGEGQGGGGPATEN